jgi:hypothetical protein
MLTKPIVSISLVNLLVGLWLGVMYEIWIW